MGEGVQGLLLGAGVSVVVAGDEEAAHCVESYGSSVFVVDPPRSLGRTLGDHRMPGLLRRWAGVREKGIGRRFRRSALSLALRPVPGHRDGDGRDTAVAEARPRAGVMAVTSGKLRGRSAVAGRERSRAGLAECGEVAGGHAEDGSRPRRERPLPETIAASRCAGRVVASVRLSLLQSSRGRRLCLLSRGWSRGQAAMAGGWGAESVSLCRAARRAVSMLRVPVDMHSV